jgi:hypothetical protein
MDVVHLTDAASLLKELKGARSSTDAVTIRPSA